MTLRLLDNSVLQRLDRSAAVLSATESLMVSGDLLAVSDVAVLEAGYSARSAEAHRQVLDVLSSSFERLDLGGGAGSVALQLQEALFGAGTGRAVGIGDLLQAGVAIEHDAVLVHYDADFELLASVDDRLRHAWIVPRGSVD